MISGRGVEGGHYQVFQHPCTPPGDGDLITIPGTDDLGSGQRLASSGEELVSGKDGLEEDVAHPQQGGGGATGVRFFLNAMVQAVLLFRSDTWVVTPRMGKALGGRVQAQVARRLKGRLLQSTLNGK